MTDLYFPPDELRPSLAADDPLPPPPYAVSLSKGPHGWQRPFTVRSMTTGQAIAGHIESRKCADAIAEALNSSAPRGWLGSVC